MINRRGVLIFIFILIILFPLITAGPYGYNNSANLNYKIVDGTIYYRYGDSTTFMTSLKPLDKNLTTWKPEFRREVVSDEEIIPVILEGIIKYTKISEVGVEYDEEIEKYFNNQTLVKQIISSANESRKAHSLAYPLEIINNETWIKVAIRFKNISYIDGIISEFGEDEIRNVINRNLTTSVGAIITKKGFEELTKEDGVEKIYIIKEFYYNNDNTFILINNIYMYIGIILIILTILIISKIKTKKRKKMINKRGMILILMVLLIGAISFVSAGPYGYNDSMNLKYKVVGGKIYYKYGNSTAYITSLRPKDANVSTWRADSRREVMSEEEIVPIKLEGKIEHVQTYEEYSRQKIINYFSNQTLVNQTIGSRGKDSFALEIIDNETWIGVSIHLKNNTNLNEFVSVFDENEIRNVSTSPFFSSDGKILAKVTKIGFDKLINDPRVEEVYLSVEIKFYSDQKYLNLNNYYIYILIVIILIISVIIILRVKRRNIKQKKRVRKMKGGISNMFLEFILIMVILILISPFINAGPYGYNDSMDLQYRISEGKIYYGYGNITSIKYATSLRPKDSNVSTWRADSRREVVDDKIAKQLFKREETKNKKVVVESNDEMLISNKGVKYEPRVLDEFNKLNQNKTWIWVSIHLENDTNLDQFNSLFDENEIRNVSTSPFFSSDGKILAKVTKIGFDKLINDPRVEEIYFDRQIKFYLTESAKLINATYVIDALGYSGNGIKVCVIDSGVDKYHPALVGKIAGEKCYCSGINCCPGGTSSGNNATDEYGHGTHVAGIIASQNQTYRGIAPNVSLYVVKVGGNLDVNGGNAIDWCTNQGVDIITMSLGDGQNHPGGGESCPSYLNTEINNAYNSGIPVIAASGNEIYINGTAYPACSSNVISVGAIDKQNFIAPYTNRDGDLPTLLAPGGRYDSPIVYDYPSEIVSPFSQLVQDDDDLCFYKDPDTWCFDVLWWSFCLLPGDCHDDNFEVDTDYIRIAGTSQAAPHVAGVAALMLEKNSSLNPDEIKQILKETGVGIYDFSTDTTYPRVNALDAVGNVSYCTATSWTSGSCGAGTCEDFQRQYTRTVDPAGCDTTTKCEYDESCIGGDTITVCSSGCDYTTIQSALNNAAYDDLIKVTDSGTYNENLDFSASADNVMLNCQGATITGYPDAITIDSMDLNSIINCIINATNGFRIIGDGYGHDIMNNVLDIEEKGIETEGDASGDTGNLGIEDNIIFNSGEIAAIYSHGTTNHPSSHYIHGNILINNLNAIYLEQSVFSRVQNNIIANNTYGIDLAGSGSGIEVRIENNNISDNSDYGIKIYNQDSTILNNNFFCSSNTNYDIYLESVDTYSGSGNTCEKPGLWNDDGKTGCTYYCDTGAGVNLLYPLNGNTIISKDDVNVVCQSNDNYNLVNVTLYHNASGTWQKNQTINITGTSNITTFTLSNIPNGTNIVWNCLSYDNMSRGSFAPLNWSLDVIIDNVSPNVNIISPLNQTYYISLINFNITLNEIGMCDYSLNKGITNISMGTADNKNFSSTNSSIGNGNYIVNYYCEDSVGNLNNSESVNFSIQIINDTHKFRITNTSGNNVAWFGSDGNIVLKGTCTSGGTCTATDGNSFIIKDGSGNEVAHVDSNGNLCIETGDCSDQSANCNSPTGSSFIVRDSGVNVAYIDSTGDLCLTGGLYENSAP